MIYNFDEIIDRVHSDSIKWNYYGQQTLPLWVADMDFVSPQPVIDALRQRVDHAIFGYATPPRELTETICERMLSLYDWKISAEDIVFLPGIVVGLNNVTHALTSPNLGVLMMTPVYGPFLTAPENAGALRQEVVLEKDKNGRYFIDFEKFENTIDEKTGMFLLCNPHNPFGRVFTRAELVRLAEICQRHKVPICSDEIHCDLIFKGHRHVPIASLSDPVAQNTITLMAPSKTYNIAGLSCAFAIVQNPEMRKKLECAQQGLVSHVNALGYQAALAAYREGGEWLNQVLEYLTINRDYLHEYVNGNFPGARMSAVEGTYLAWIDFRGTKLRENPFSFFLKQAGVALNDGMTFGAGGEGFVRLNFACPKSVLEEALKRMKMAFDQIEEALEEKK
jgi:cystathionine beta-lyase